VTLGIVAVVERLSVGTVVVVVVVVAEAAREDQLFEAQDTVDDRSVLAVASTEVEVVTGPVQAVVPVGFDGIHLACFRHFAAWEKNLRDIHLAGAHEE
jgi:hypothetical protein